MKLNREKLKFCTRKINYRVDLRKNFCWAKQIPCIEFLFLLRDKVFFKKFWDDSICFRNEERARQEFIRSRQYGENGSSQDEMVFNDAGTIYDDLCNINKQK